MTEKKFEQLEQMYGKGGKKPYGFVLKYKGNDPEVKKYLKKGLLSVRNSWGYGTNFTVESSQLKRKETVINSWNNGPYIQTRYDLKIDLKDWDFDKEATAKRVKAGENMSAAQKKRAKKTEDTRALKRAEKHLPKVLDRFIQNMEYFRPTYKVKKLLDDLPVWHRFTLLSKMPLKHRAALAIIEQRFGEIAKIIVDGVIEEEPKSEE